MRGRLVVVAVLAGAFLLPLSASAASPAQVEHGNRLYGHYCLSCHGAKGAGTHKAPSLRGAGALAADFYLRTGYMPLHELGTQPRRTRVLFDEGQLRALTAYVASLGKGPPIPKPQPSRGNLAEGLHAFTEHCAGCHQIVAEGGYVTGALPPALENATDVQIAEAVRIGPYVMPTFSKAQISDRTLNSIIAYVDYAKHPDDPGGWALGHLGPVPEGLVTWFIAAALALAFCVVIGKRLRRP